jgi:hypothetical protein
MPSCILASNLSQMDASMITALLEDSQIPSFIKDRGVGGYLKIYMGYTIYGQDIYVNSDSYEKAKELLDFYFNSNVEDMELEDDFDIENRTSEEALDESSNSRSFKGSTVARIIIFLIILISITSIILNRFF